MKQIWRRLFFRQTKRWKFQTRKHWQEAQNHQKIEGAIQSTVYQSIEINGKPKSFSKSIQWFISIRPTASPIIPEPIFLYSHLFFSLAIMNHLVVAYLMKTQPKSGISTLCRGKSSRNRAGWVIEGLPSDLRDFQGFPKPHPCQRTQQGRPCWGGQIGARMGFQQGRPCWNTDLPLPTCCSIVRHGTAGSATPWTSCSVEWRNQ